MKKGNAAKCIEQTGVPLYQASKVFVEASDIVPDIVLREFGTQAREHHKMLTCLVLHWTSHKIQVFNGRQQL